MFDFDDFPTIKSELNSESGGPEQADLVEL